jgi:hypothetical protein
MELTTDIYLRGTAWNKAIENLDNYELQDGE